jgi:hypothetical protein
LPGQQTLLRRVNRNMATRRLTSAAYIARDIELRSVMLGVAIRTTNFFLLVDRRG